MFSQLFFLHNLSALTLAIVICIASAERHETTSPEFWTKQHSHSGPPTYRRQVTSSQAFQPYIHAKPTASTPPSKIQKVLSQVEETLRHEDNCRLNKIKLAQLESAQYIEYAVNFPPLKQFHFCLWLNSVSLTTEHTLFSYAVPRNPDMITMWISPIQNQTGFHLVINGLKVYNLNYAVPTGKWFHICQSWNGLNGHFEVFVNGISVGDGYGPPKLIGFEVPGGGRPVTGQGQDSAWNDVHGRRHGVQGEITLFEMDDAALGVGAKGSATLRPLQTDCLPRRTGNLISWGKAHLKLFGGAEIYGVSPICASFPE